MEMPKGLLRKQASNNVSDYFDERGCCLIEIPEHFGVSAHTRDFEQLDVSEKSPEASLSGDLGNYIRHIASSCHVSY